MAKLVLIAARSGAQVPFSAADLAALYLAALFNRLTPDNITSLSSRVLENHGTLVGILNPADSTQIKNQSVCMGVLLNPHHDWWKTGAQAPDGSYALFRSDENIIELLSDIVASRTIWYAQTNELFLAATSQRAIVFFLQSFNPNENVYPWMLSSGTLGPGLSWDTRIKCLPGDTRLILDRSSWQISTERKPVVFKPQHRLRREHTKRLTLAIQESFDQLHLDLDRWLLPLSGGFDSRMLLLMLKDRTGLKTITWGEKKALANKYSDASVAKQLAQYYRLENSYFPLDSADDPPDKIFSRFLVAGEGRIDHIAGYMDGFAIWKSLFEHRVQGVLRGDEAFGCRRGNNDDAIRRNMGLVTMHDYEQGNLFTKYLGDYAQHIPPFLSKRPNETIATWRDRLYTEFEMPTMLAALNDLKLPYVEICNPLLSRRIIEQVRHLPDNLRTDKTLFKEIVTSMSGYIGFARHVAISSRSAILKRPPIIELMLNQLNTPKTECLFPSEFISYLSIAMHDGLPKPRLPRLHKAKHALIRYAAKTAHRERALHINPYTLAFRAFIISRMIDVLNDDANAIKNTQKRRSVPDNYVI